MKLVFDDIEIDVRAAVVRRGGDVVPVEPQVFEFLLYLAQNGGRLITRREIIDTVWGGRIVSDAALDSRVRAVRAAVGDSGQAQRIVQTVRGRGLRFLAEVRTVAAAAPPTAAAAATPAALPDIPAPADPTPSTQPSVCVLPFAALGEDASTAALARAIPHDLVTGLSRLRWIFVISRASSFHFAAGRDDPFDAARALGARYCLTGMVEVFAGRLTVTTELTDTERGGVIWADRDTAALDDVHEVRERLVTAVISAMEVRVPAHEATRAALRSPDRLDAWGAYHLGLRHMYRFSEADNAEATRLFSHAIALDPAFARAHAAQSCASFQSAFGHMTGEVERERHRALAAAEEAIALDPLEPFAHYAMGRALWLQGDLDSARTFISRCIDLNPNHAQGFYCGGLIDLLSGERANVVSDAEKAMRLSPLDPMRYAMLMLNGLALVADGRYEEATLWAGRSTREPNSHAVMETMAAMAYELAGDRETARHWLRSALDKQPGFSQADFFKNLDFQDETLRRTIADAFDRLGLK